MGVFYFMKRLFSSLKKDILVPLNSSVGRLCHEYAIQANFPYLQKNTQHLERIQKAATRWVEGLVSLTYHERLIALKLQVLEKR